jgi:hypothetical protein
MDQLQLARERAANGQCIICGSNDTRITRGLCVKHHTRYHKQRNAIKAGGHNVEAFDEALIERGLLLPSKQGRSVDPDEDVFASVARELFQVSPSEQLADEMLADAEAIEQHHQSKKKAAKKKSTRSQKR